MFITALLFVATALVIFQLVGWMYYTCKLSKEEPYTLASSSLRHNALTTLILGAVLGLFVVIGSLGLRVVNIDETIKTQCVLQK